LIKRLLLSGYKSQELGIFDNKHVGITYIKKAILKKLSYLLEEGLEWVIISGQLGVELWAAEVVLELKEKEHPNLNLAVITPYLDQEKNWKEDKQEYYNGIIGRADFVSAVSKQPYQGPWQLKAKNAFLMDHSDALLLVYDEEKEGTPKYMFQEAVRRSESEEYTLLTINSYDLQSIIEEDQFNDTF
jgi:uncharacterized phage-like protein YoqJ